MHYSIATCLTALAALPASKPNIIYILADDLGYGDLGCYGQTRYPTPNLDNLAREGMRFTQHYAGCTVSAPSRCSLMTGLHTGHTPIRGNTLVTIDGEPYDSALPDPYKTIAECLKEQHYTTACIGKWGMGGPGTEGHPNNQGFDYFYGHLGQEHAHFTYPRFLYENNTRVNLNQIPKDKLYYSQDLFMEKVRAFITNNKDNPFFLYFSTPIPHAELITSDQDMKKFQGLYPEPNPYPPGAHYGADHGGQPHPRAAFAAMVSRLDGDVGRLRTLLEQLGIAHNTLIIFTSDNGPHKEGGADPEFFNSSGGLRGIKRDLYEGGIRVPMIAYWPNVVKKKTVCHQPTAFWDVLPTLCDIAGADTPPNIDGLSFLPALKGKKQTPAHTYLYWEFLETPTQAIRQGKWKAIRKHTNQGPIIELYNLQTDKYEKNNVAPHHPEVVAQLEKLMNSLFRPHPNFPSGDTTKG